MTTTYPTKTGEFKRWLDKRQAEFGLELYRLGLYVWLDMRVAKQKAAKTAIWKRMVAKTRKNFDDALAEHERNKPGAA